MAVKAFVLAKRRVGGLAAEERMRLASTLASGVVSTLAASAWIGGTIVVGESDARSLALRHGAAWCPEPAGGGLNAAVAAGLGRSDAGCARLVVMADLPLLTPAVADGLAGADGAEVALYASADGTGTNAVRLGPQVRFTPQFGEASLARHVAWCRAAGVTWRIGHLPAVALDVDTAEDLLAARSLGFVWPGRRPAAAFAGSAHRVQAADRNSRQPGT